MNFRQIDFFKSLYTSQSLFFINHLQTIDFLQRLLLSIGSSRWK